MTGTGMSIGGPSETRGVNEVRSRDDAAPHRVSPARAPRRCRSLTAGVHLHALLSEFADRLPPGARMLDAGAGDSPYRDLFAHLEYEAADVCIRDTHRYEHVQHVCDLTAIPVEDERYDFVLCTQVLEHVPEPHRVLAELFRVLKPGGLIWLSTPLFFEEHEVPYDYFRYTQFGLRSLMTRAGFEVREIGWVEGYLGTLAYQLNFARHHLPRSPAGYGGGPVGWLAAGASCFIRPLFLLLALVFSRLDVRAKFTDAGHCMDYYVVAHKPVDRADG